MNNINFKVLEGVRGLAAFAVVLNHARGNLFVGGGISRVATITELAGFLYEY